MTTAFRYASELRKGDRFIEFHDVAGEPVIGEVDEVMAFGNGAYRVVYRRECTGRLMVREHHADFPVVAAVEVDEAAETAMASAR